MSSLDPLIEQLEFVVGCAEGQVPDPILETAAKATRQIRQRVGHLGSTLVLALLGGTGVGKSSLLNAIAGAPVASVSPIRPHTTRPLAWVPVEAEPGLATLLDRLAISQRVSQDLLSGTAILDMTDVDSLESGHRTMVEHLLPQVDVAIWVFDPVKYADALLHAEFIAPMSGLADRMLFVLNRVDTLSPRDRVEVVDHLHELLVADGIARPIVFETSASPPFGEPSGVATVVDHLRHRLEEKTIRLSRIIAEAGEVAHMLASAAGVVGGSATGFDSAWSEVRALARAAPSAGRAGFESLCLAAERVVLDVAARSGPVLGPALLQAFPPHFIARLVEESLARPGPRGEGADAELERRLGAPLRDHLWGRARFAAAVAGLAVEAAVAEHRFVR